MYSVRSTNMHRSILSGVILFLVVFVSSVLAQPPVVQGPQGKLESPFTKIYEKVSPSVVKIDVKTPMQRQQMSNPFPLPQFFNTPQRQQRNQPQEEEGVGSGVIIDREGHVITNNHVVAGARTIKVYMSEDESFDATVVGRDSLTDIAVIKLDLKGATLPATAVAELGDSDTLKPGDYAIALGNPLGLDRTITVGVVSAIGRTDLQTEDGALVYQNFIQTDAQINPGNSGGALCDIDGKVVGINDMYTAQYAGIGFAIPINIAKMVVPKLIANGRIDRGFLGIGGKDVDKATQNALDLPSATGVLIDNIVADSPAAKAGLKSGDVILSLNGQAIKNYIDFRFKIAAFDPGATIQIETISEGSHKSMTVTLANQVNFASAMTSPGAGGSAPRQGQSGWRGITVADVNDPQYRAQVPDTIKSGVLVTAIAEGSPAADSDLEVGYIITAVTIENSRNVPIKTVGDFDALRQKYRNSNRAMLLNIVRIYPNGRTTPGTASVGAE
jgi:Do/DeqQ family serine protease